MTKSSAKPKRRKPRKAGSASAKKANRKIALETTSDTRRKTVVSERLRGSTMRDASRGGAERNVAQTRELYEQSKNTIQAMLDRWQKTFGAPGQGALALNRRIFDITDYGIKNNFDFATALVGAKNLAEVAELQTAYWRKQLIDLTRLTDKTRS
jgi:hypothetical protein